MADKKFNISDAASKLLSEAINKIAGKKSKFNLYGDIINEIKEVSGLGEKISKVEERATQWLVFKALMNPNIASAIFQLRSFINDKNAEILNNISRFTLLTSPERNSLLLGIAVSGFITKKFEISQESKGDIMSVLEQLTDNDDKMVRSAAVATLESLDKNSRNQKDLEDANDFLYESGFNVFDND